MRLPDHLFREPSGIFYFRPTVPKSLREVVGKRDIWKSLHTNEPATAKARAYVLSARYPEEFKTMKPKLDDVLQAARASQRINCNCPTA